jgi:hypothetical protein
MKAEGRKVEPSNRHSSWTDLGGTTGSEGVAVFPKFLGGTPHLSSSGSSGQPGSEPRAAMPPPRRRAAYGSGASPASAELSFGGAPSRAFVQKCGAIID